MNSRSVREMTYRVWGRTGYDEYMRHRPVRREVLGTVRARLNADATRDDVRELAEQVIREICGEIEERYVRISSIRDIETYVSSRLSNGAFCGLCAETVLEDVAYEVAGGDHPDWGTDWSPYLRYVDIVALAEQAESEICRHS